MKLLRFECFSGISGDMTLAALNDLGVPAEYISAELQKLNIEGIDIEFETVEKNGIQANSAKICAEEQHVHRNFADIRKIISDSGISDNAKQIACDIFLIIAEAEAKVHGEPVDKVHFHEVGALDSIIDIVGVAVCVDYLKPDKIIATVINDGRGFIKCQHGIIPVPVPAVAEIFAGKRIKSNSLDVGAELVTPTGAGIIAALADFSYNADGLAACAIGYGAGSKELDMPNVLRVSICEGDDIAENEPVSIVETNIDDQTPESLSFAMERIFASGALEVFFTPVYMKKNRPAVVLTAICKKCDEGKICEAIFHNTTTIGLRIREERRLCLERLPQKRSTRYGEIDVKLIRFAGTEKISPEFESAREAALKHGVSIEDVYKCVFAETTV